MTAGHVGLTLSATYFVTGNVELSLFACLVQGIGDLLRHFEITAGMKMKGSTFTISCGNKYGGWDESYDLFHKPWNTLSGWRLFFFILFFWILIFPIGLHCGYDYFCHYKDTEENRIKDRVGDWNVFAKVSEVSWSLVGVYTILIMFGLKLI